MINNNKQGMVLMDNYAEIDYIKKQLINLFDYCEYLEKNNKDLDISLESLENQVNILIDLVIYLLKQCNVIESLNDDNIDTIIENEEVL